MYTLKNQLWFLRSLSTFCMLFLSWGPRWVSYSVYSGPGTEDKVYIYSFKDRVSIFLKSLDFSLWKVLHDNKPLLIPLSSHLYLFLFAPFSFADGR